MAEAAVRNGSANLAMVPVMAALACTIATASYRSSTLITPSRLCPAQAEMGSERDCSVEGPDAGRGLSHHRASFQPALDQSATDDGGKKPCGLHAQEASLSDSRSQKKAEASCAATDPAQSNLGLRSPGQDGSTGATVHGPCDPRSCQPGVTPAATVVGQVLLDVVAGIGSRRETIWSAAVRANG